MLKRANRNSVYLEKEKEKERGSLSPSNSASTPASQGLAYSKLSFLSRAIEKNREEEALAIVKSGKGPSVISETDLSGRNCAHICAALGTLSMFQLLLNHEVEYNIADESGATPLHYASSNLRFEIIEKLLTLPSINIRAVDKNGQTALHFLVAQSKIPREKKTAYTKICKEMINKGADLHARDSNGDTPLHEACKYGNTTATKFIVVQRGVEIDPTNINKDTPLHIAARRGDKRITKILLERDADLTMENNKGTPIDIAKENGQQEVLALMLSHLEKKKKQSAKMSMRKTKISEEDVIKQLEFYAEKKDRVEDFKNLVAEYKIDNQRLINTTSNTGRNLMMIANYHGNWELVSFLLSKGFPVNGQDKNGWTNLHYAACSDNAKVILSLLKQRDINVNIKNADQTTALHYIAKNVFFPRELPEIFEALQQKFMHFNGVNVNGETALHNSCWKGNLVATKLLIEKGVNVNTKNRKNETALHWAVRAGHEEIVNILLQNSADVNIKGDDGTPLEIAQKALVPNDNIITALGGKPKTMEQKDNDKRSWFHHMLNKQKEQQQNGADVASDVKFELPVNLNWLIKESEVEVHELLGSGRFGSVYRGIYRGQTVAVKHLQNVNGKYELKKEFDIMSSMRSPRVVYFYGVVLTPPFTAYMVMSYCAKGSLTNVLRDPLFNLEWPMVFKWCRQIVQGVNDLHCWVPQIIHRDLKSLNLLVDEYYDCVVSDFGISRFVVDDNLSTLSKLRGTYAYCAPEIYLGQPAGVKSDVFSLGIIFWEIASRCIRGEYIRPYSEYKHLILDFQIIIQVAKDKLRPKLPNGCPELMANLIQACWDSAEEQRPSCKQILEMLSQASKHCEANPDQWPRFQPHLAGANTLDNLFSPLDDKDEEKDDEEDDELPQPPSEPDKKKATVSFLTPTDTASPVSSPSPPRSDLTQSLSASTSTGSTAKETKIDNPNTGKLTATVSEGSSLGKSFPSFRIPTRIASAPDTTLSVPAPISPSSEHKLISFFGKELKRNSSQESQESHSPRSPPNSISPRVSRNRSNRSSVCIDGDESEEQGSLSVENGTSSLRYPKSPKSPSTPKSKVRLSLRGSKTFKQDEMTWFDYIQTPEYAESVKDSPS